jgi:methyl-accepting chemotaxis protein
MYALDSFSIRTRFYIVMVAVVASLLALGGWGLVSSQVANQNASKLFEQAHDAATDLGNLRESISLVRRWELNIIAIGASNSVEVQRLIGVWKQEIKNVKAAGDKLAGADAADSEIGALLKKQDGFMQAYEGLLEPILKQIEGAQIDGSVAMAYASKADDTLAALKQNTEDIKAAQQTRVSAAREEMAAQATAASLLRLGLVGLTLCLFIPLMWLTLRSVCRPLDRAVAVASRIAQGDLSSDIQAPGRDETAQLLQALKAMQASLREVVGDVRDSADSINIASREVANGNQDLSRRTENTASNLQQTASAMTQLTQNVQHSADSGGQANQLASRAAEVAARGAAVVAKVVTTMEDINASSKKIADITSVIDSIAFQTNILALNAAVEAAQAGEQGRGFAVVAGEVRSLASRSAQAAKEIKELIADSVRGVQTGASLVAQAGKNMEDIVVSVQQVSDIISEVTTAASEQSQGIGRINAAVGELEQMTQQNAALVEQSAAAAESLKEQAARLSQVVAIFQLGSDAAG